MNEARDEKISYIRHNRLRPRHRHKYTKYKMCLSIVMGIYILSNTYASFKVQFRKMLRTLRLSSKKHRL